MGDRYLLEHGIDTMRLGGFIGTTHESSALGRIIDAYRGMVELLAKSGVMRDSE